MAVTKEIKTERLTKRTNRKQNFKKFVESDYTDYAAFLGACKNDENLLIYTCLPKAELQPYIIEMKKLSTLKEQTDYLAQNQPHMNKTPELFDECVKSIAKYLKPYIEYNGFKMANSDGDAEDWTSEFWAKYCKICDFYRTRWFYPERLKKESTVEHTPMLYKEFIYVCRMSITGERKNQAFKATQNQDTTLFKISLDSKIESVGDNEKTLADVIPDEERDVDYILDQANLNRIFEKALELCKQYPDALKQYDQIKSFYEKQDPVGFDKKTVILGKIFLYKAGLVSIKTLTFIKLLSSTYKSRYNISPARVNAQLLKLKGEKIKSPIKKKTKNTNKTWRELIFRKRGEI